jgi:hypothetical protein
MDVQSKGISLRYSISILVVCFAIVLFSINQIINLAKPNLSSYSISNKDYKKYAEVTMLASSPNQDYKKFTSELSEKFPTQPGMALKLNISPDIAKLPVSEQANAIQLRILEARVGYLQNELTKISEAQSESLIYKLWIYVWSILIWTLSIIFGRVLEHITDKFYCK